MAQQQQQQKQNQQLEPNRSEFCCDISNDAIASHFPNVLPSSRLGEQLSSLEAFRHRLQAAGHSVQTIIKEYSLVVVTEAASKRILLGKKHRGFGTGLYNSFGGKLHPDQETMVQCACRELHEETGIVIAEEYMAQSLVGAMHFTFQDEPVKMIVRVYHIDITTATPSTTTTTTNIPSSRVDPYPMDPNCIRGCDEITPEWMDHGFDIPLDNMFADDSLWLTRLLWAFFQHKQRLNIDGYFHFHPGGQDVNAIQFYYMNIRTKRKRKRNSGGTGTTVDAPMTLEKRLFHALHSNQIHSPSIKEFKEAFAFCNAVKFHFKKQQSFHVIIDVAGGHGALAALLMITTSAKRGIVIDPAKVGKNGVQRAWGADFLQGKALEYRHEDLRTGLPSCLTQVLQTVPRNQVLVVACHACQHLSEEILEIVCTQFEGVHAAVMPCCQNDSTGGSWKAASQRLEIPIAPVMDLLLAGKAMSWNLSYEVRMKLIDASITPQNRVILCRAIGSMEQQQQQTSKEQKKLEAAHQKLAATYIRAHTPKKDSPQRSRYYAGIIQLSPYQLVGGACLVAVGFLTGFVAANLANRKR